MYRKLLATTALSLVLTGGAFAQDAQEQAMPADDGAAAPAGEMAPAGDAAAQPAPESEGEPIATAEESGINSDGWLASELMGQTIYNSTADDAEAIGDVNDFVLDQNGEIGAIVVGVGGFLGIGQKSVAINWDDMEMAADPNGAQRLVANMSREQLESAQEFNAEEWLASQQATAEGGAMAPAGEGAMAPADGDQGAMAPAEGDAAAPAEGDDAMVPAEGDAAAPAEGEDAMAPAEGDAAAPAEGEDAMAPAEGDAAAPAEGEDAMAPAEGDAAAPAEGDDAMAPAEGDAAAPAEGEDAMAPAEGDAAAPAEGDAAMAPAEGGEMAAGPANFEEFETVATGDISAEELTGTPVYGAENEQIASIGDIILSDEGSVEAVIVDFGGFLGIGTKPVAIAYQNLEFYRDAGDNLVLRTSFTAEDLDAAPEYNPDTYADAPNDQLVTME